VQFHDPLPFMARAYLFGSTFLLPYGQGSRARKEPVRIFGPHHFVSGPSHGLPTHKALDGTLRCNERIPVSFLPIYTWASSLRYRSVTLHIIPELRAIRAKRDGSFGPEPDRSSKHKDRQAIVTSARRAARRFVSGRLP
jgi:hypothetical protein